MEKILFISQRIPYPPNKGCKIRSFNEIKYLSRHYKVDVVTFIDDKNDNQYVKDLEKYCNDLYTFPINKKISMLKGLLFLLIGKSFSEGYYFFRRVKTLVSYLIKNTEYKFIFCFSSQVAQYGLCSKNKVTKVMDFCDVDSDKFRQYSLQAPFPMYLIYKLESKRLSKYENKIYQLFDKSIFITIKEVRLFLKKSFVLPEHLPEDFPKIHVIGNGIDFDYFKPVKAEKENTLVFTGDMSYYANVQGVSWFCNEVFPRILKIIPDMKFYIVGRNPTKAVKKLANKNVIVTGAVDDVRPFLAFAKMALIPLSIARGVQNKILEAMAMGIPVIISEDLYGTLNNISKDDIFTFSLHGDLIKTITESINNDALLEERGKHHREYVLNNLNWNSIFEKSDIWSDL